MGNLTMQQFLQYYVMVYSVEGLAEINQQCPDAATFIHIRLPRVEYKI